MRAKALARWRDAGQSVGPLDAMRAKAMGPLARGISLTAFVPVGYIARAAQAAHERA